MKIIKGYNHKVASHCESGTLRNLFNFAGLEVSEPMMFGIGSGVVFAYLTNAKGISGFPITAIRLPMGKIFDNVKKLCGIDLFSKKYRTTDDGIKVLNDLIDSGQPAAICVDMFYMKYLPPFMQIHAPFHFVVIVGRDGDKYAVSDPYSPGIGELSLENLKLAWEPHAMFSNDNYLAYIKGIPDNINWKDAIIKSIKRACTNMNIPAFVNKLLPVFGVGGIRFFAKQIPLWTKNHRGLALREGVLFTPTILEEQGTGGGGFRMLYAAFLNESSNIFESDDLRAIANKMGEIGEKWRDASRFLLKVGKTIPMNDNEYEDWYSKNESILNGSLEESCSHFMEIADMEKEVFTELKNLLPSLK